MSTDVALFGFDCGECGHHHAGQTLAYICVGCPCTNTGDGNQHERDLRGNTGAGRTSGDDTRDQSLAVSRADAAEQQVKEMTTAFAQLKLAERGTDRGWIDDDAVERARHTALKACRRAIESQVFQALLADRDHAREERDTLQAIVADVFAVLGESDIEYKAPFLHRRMKAAIKKAEGR